MIRVWWYTVDKIDDFLRWLATPRIYMRWDTNAYFVSGWLIGEGKLWQAIAAFIIIAAIGVFLEKVYE